MTDQTTEGRSMTDKAKEIAEGLSYAQSAALRGIFAWPDPASQHEGEALLYREGLWNPKPKHGEKAITALGIEVRNHLKDTTT